MNPEQGSTGGIRSRTYRYAAVWALVLIALATTVYKYAEDWSWVDAFYFSTVAVTTVGFGDLSPTTDGTKLFTVFYVVTGISLVGLVLDERMKRHARHRRSRRDDPADDE